MKKKVEIENTQFRSAPSHTLPPKKKKKKRKKYREEKIGVYFGKMAQKRYSVDQALARLVGDTPFSDEEVGGSEPDSFSSLSEEYYLDGKDGHEDR